MAAAAAATAIIILNQLKKMKKEEDVEDVEEEESSCKATSYVRSHVRVCLSADWLGWAVMEKC